MKFSVGNRAIVRSVAVTGALLFLPTLLSAHPGHGDMGGFSHGFFHPLSGIDHLCAMVAVGLWAAWRGGRALWAAPLTFVGVMALGALLSMSGIPLPFVEGGIIASVLVLGVLIASAVRLQLAFGVGLIGLFALFHGYAHGTEMPVAASGALYGFGFILSTVALHLGGLALGYGLSRFEKDGLIRYAGAAIAVVGIGLAVIG